MNDCVVDLQGFQYKNSSFICKELSIKQINKERSSKVTTFIFNYDIDEDNLSKDFQKQICFLENHVHGLSWKTTLNNLLVYKYCELSKLFNEEITRNKYVNIYVKGKQKMDWVKSLLDSTNIQVINIENVSTYQLANLKNLQDNYICRLHFPKLRCTINNVIFMNECLTSNKTMDKL